MTQEPCDLDRAVEDANEALCSAEAVCAHGARLPVQSLRLVLSALRQRGETLEWYGEQARLARLIHSEGDAGRHALSADGGTRARAAAPSTEGGGGGHPARALSWPTTKAFVDAAKIGGSAANRIGAAEIEVGQAVYRRIEALMDSEPQGAELNYLADLVSSVEEYGSYDGPVAAPTPPSADSGVREALERFGQNQSLELAYCYDPDIEGDEGAWCVHRVDGGRNDREWTLLARADNPTDAVRQALPQPGSSSGTGG